MEVPTSLLDRLNEKLCNGIFDIGDAVCFRQNSDDNDDNDDNDNDDSQWLVWSNDMKPLQDIYLIDHMWTVDSLPSAYTQMHNNVDLVKRLIGMTSNLDNDISLCDKVIDDLFEQIVYLFGSYYYNDNKCLYYLMDEVGCHLQPAKDMLSANCISTLVQTHEFAYTVIWPIKNVSSYDTIKCYNLPSGINKYRCLTRVLNDVNDNIMFGEYAANLKAVLIRYQYNSIKINTMIAKESNSYLQCWEHSSLSTKAIIAEKLHNEYMKEYSSLVKLITLFYLGLPENEDVIVDILGVDLLQFLISANICINENGMITSLVQLTPVVTPDGDDEGLIVMTDYAHQGSWKGLGLEDTLDPVMYIGPDSLGLLHFFQAGGIKYNNALDICAGTGVQAIAAIKHGGLTTATCVDINPRAIRFIHFNAHMNGVFNRLTIINADVTNYDETKILKNSQFDLLLLNPPYIPSDNDGDDEFLVFGAGGVDGEFITKSAAALFSDMNNDADFYIVANFINCDDYPQKLKTWVGNCQGKLFHGTRWSPAEYANLVLPNSQFNSTRASSRKKYEQFLITSGVKDVVNGVLAFSKHTDVNNIQIQDMKCEIWQVLSGSYDKGKIKEEIRESLKLLLS